MNKALCIPAMAGACIIAGCVFQPRINGSGRIVTTDMAVADFSSLHVSSTFTVVLRHADSFGVTITADDNLFEYIEAQKRGTTLYIGLPEVSLGSATLQAIVTLPALKKLELHGRSDATFDDFTSVGAVTVVIAGASQLRGTLKADTLRLQCHGASKVAITGSATDAILEGSEASSLELADFPITNGAVTLSDSSSATIHVTATLDYDVNGASELHYTGDPRMGKQSLSGSSRISRR